MKNTIKGNFVGFTNGDPTITNSKDTIKEMTNNKQQTAVEWYDNEIGKLFDQYTMGKIKIYEFQNQRFKLEKQAKEMQKDQHIKSWEAGLMKVDFNEYYNENYGEDDSLKINNGGHQI
jgi:hypothetical protein